MEKHGMAKHIYNCYFSGMVLKLEKKGDSTTIQ